jgi:hypothetical protein
MEALVAGLLVEASQRSHKSQTCRSAISAQHEQMRVAVAPARQSRGACRDSVHTRQPPRRP